MAKKIKVIQRRGLQHQTERQIGTVRALGLMHIRHIKEHADTPVLRGMVKKVAHLVSIVEEK